jgi:phosphotransferase system enzyme I (PtsI)
MILIGKGAAPGAAVGNIYIYNEKCNIPAESFVREGEEQSHLDRYVSVKAQALIELEEIRRSMQKIEPAKAAIFDAHKEIVEDIIINEEIPARILNERWSGDWAIYHVYETVLQVLRQTPDPLISERAADFDNVRALLLKLWYGQKTCNLSSLTEPCIIAARELLPSDTASLDREKVLAIITETGGITSHAAIIAKSYGIPTVLGIEGLLSIVKQGQLSVVDATEGKVILDPEADVAEEYLKKSNALRRDREDAETFRYTEAHTSCGIKIDIGLNISTANDEELTAANYVDFAGLFRTEFLVLGRNSLPSEEEQFNIYKKVLESFGQKPVILRTFDIGGDKQFAFVEKREENPFLGNRGVRFCLGNPSFFKTQIRAALRASVFGNLWLMFPMVGSLDDIHRAKEHIAAAATELKKEGQPYNAVKIGIMIEVPSIALIADFAAQKVDFASIGSNDLCQYLCAADRMNTEVESYYQNYHPAMFRMIKETVTSFNEIEKPISICGEFGSDPLAVPALIGLGLRKFSMSEASVAAVKRTIASITLEQAQEIAKNVLGFSTADEIKEYLGNL